MWDQLDQDPSINQYLTTFKMLLTFESWTKKRDGYWKSSTYEQCQAFDGKDPNKFPIPPGQKDTEAAIARLIWYLTDSSIPCLTIKGEYTKSQWAVPKVHWIQHYPKNITCYGLLLGQDVEIGEHSHKHHGKCIALTAQK